MRLATFLSTGHMNDGGSWYPYARAWMPQRRNRFATRLQTPKPIYAITMATDPAISDELMSAMDSVRNRRCLASRPAETLRMLPMIITRLITRVSGIRDG